MSSANFVERAIAGLEPDVALLAPLARKQVHDYTPRLLRALNYPGVVLPTHWDNWERPLTEPPQDPRAVLGDDGNLDVFVREVKRSEEHTSELQSQSNLVCRLLLEKKKKKLKIVTDLT